MPETDNRPELARLHGLMVDLLGPDNALTRDFLHMRAGTPYGEAAAWFRRAHDLLDAATPAVVEIRRRKFLRDKALRLEGRHVLILRDAVLVDGVEREELRGATVRAVTWVSGRGKVDIRRDEALGLGKAEVRVRGIINGVAVSLA